MKENEHFKIFMHNLIDYLSFGISLYKKGTCDKVIRGNYFVTETADIYGYTKQEAANLCKLSVRQFDRYVKQGKLPKGKKVKNFTKLFWDRDFIDKLSKLRKK